MRKNGFTLIELLAVIVILAIIALIATPIILGIISDAKKESQERSVELYLSAVELAVTRKNLTEEFHPNECVISNSVVTCDGKILDVEANGEKPVSGTIKFENNKATTGTKLAFDEFEATIDADKKIVIGPLVPKEKIGKIYLRGSAALNTYLRNLNPTTCEGHTGGTMAGYTVDICPLMTTDGDYSIAMIYSPTAGLNTARVLSLYNSKTKEITILLTHNGLSWSSSNTATTELANLSVDEYLNGFEEIKDDVISSEEISTTYSVGTTIGTMYFASGVTLNKFLYGINAKTCAQHSYVSSYDICPLMVTNGNYVIALAAYNANSDGTGGGRYLIVANTSTGQSTTYIGCSSSGTCSLSSNESSSAVMSGSTVTSFVNGFDTIKDNVISSEPMNTTYSVGDTIETMYFAPGSNLKTFLYGINAKSCTQYSYVSGYDICPLMATSGDYIIAVATMSANSDGTGGTRYVIVANGSGQSTAYIQCSNSGTCSLINNNYSSTLMSGSTVTGFVNGFETIKDSVISKF